jgi:cytochrome c-type biogenesis protein
MEIPFALAFTAGLVATVNPCGFAMLPAYLSFFIGGDDAEAAASQATTAASLGRGLVVGAVVSAGFLAVFGVAGVLLTAGVQATVRALPWAAMVVGIGVIGLGIAMLAGRELRVSLPKVGRVRDGKGLGGVFLFGISYAIASLSCTLPVFLVVVAGTIPQLGFVAGVATFLVYGLGMSALLVVVTLALALGKRAVVTWLRRASQHVNRVAGGILVVAGAYIVLFWVSTLAGDGTSQLAPVVWVEQLSSVATNWISRWAGVLAIVASVAVAAAVIAVWAARRHGDSGGARLVREDTSRHFEGVEQGVDEPVRDASEPVRLPRSRRVPGRRGDPAGPTTGASR